MFRRLLPESGCWTISHPAALYGPRNVWLALNLEGIEVVRCTSDIGILRELVGLAMGMLNNPLLISSSYCLLTPADAPDLTVSGRRAHRQFRASVTGGLRVMVSRSPIRARHRVPPWRQGSGGRDGPAGDRCPEPIPARQGKRVGSWCSHGIVKTN